MQDATLKRIKQPNSIGLDYAIQLTTNWRHFLHKKMGESFRGFLIPFTDIQDILDAHKDNPDITGVRGYMGLADENDPSTVRFIMVPVDKDGKDILKMKFVSIDGKEESVTTIYDFTQPCPAFCDKESRLYSNHL